MLIDWGSWTQRDARVAPRANVEVPPNPGSTRSHPRNINPSNLFTVTNRRRKGRFHRSILPHTVWEPQPHWLIIDRLGLMDPARRKGCPSGESRSPAEPGEYKVPSSHQNVLYISTTPTNGGENEGSPGRYRPARSVNPNPIADADWLGRVKGARGEHCPSKQRRGPAEPVEDNVSSLD